MTQAEIQETQTMQADVNSTDPVVNAGINMSDYTTAGLKIYGEFEFNVAPEKLWPYISTASGIASWFPIILGGSHDNAPSENKGTCGVGAKRYCKTLGMGTLEETMLYWDEPRAYVFDVKNVFLPVKNYAGAMVLDKITSNKTRFTWSIHFDFKGVVMRHIMPPMMVMFMNIGLNGLAKKIGGKGGKMQMV